MEVVMMPVHQLQPAPYNPRICLKPGMAGYERLRRSLTEFSLVQPLIWNRRTGYVVGGHQRLEILKREGVAEIPVVVVDLTEDREKALNLTLNNQRVGGEWDVARLGTLVDELRALPNFDATLTGFDARELRDLVMEPAAVSREAPPEEKDVVRVVLDVSRDDWDEVEACLDDLLQRFRIELHSGETTHPSASRKISRARP